ncbi:MAG TPA: GDP-mannose 4,6-dehydratase [Candidatus Limnocylindria bacterium]|jgi:GDP-4-dehydro-6-deoxy-D-mannose reductase|nr:GDP-mannose 4,6-dehydratase [Candidatus Limnocylindria bacterium]
MRALVVGADGFVGRHLVDHLRDAGDVVVEAVGPHTAAEGDRRPIDVRDPAAVERIVSDVEPEALYHLAAVAYGPDAAKDLESAIAITVGGTANVLAAVASRSPRTIVFVSGSSEVYGAPDVPFIPESAQLRPVNVYGATKVAQEAIALAYGRAHELRVIASRSFNHIGPGQRDSFAIASFAQQLRAIEMGDGPPRLRVGNLDSVRDFTDVRDVVRAYRLLVSGGHTGEPINVASGQGHTLRAIVERLIRLSGLEISIEVDPSRIRSQDAQRIVGDATRLRSLTGWIPTIPIERTLSDIWASLHATR